MGGCFALWFRNSQFPHSQFLSASICYHLRNAFCNAKTQRSAKTTKTTKTTTKRSLRHLRNLRCFSPAVLRLQRLRRFRSGRLRTTGHPGAGHLGIALIGVHRCASVDEKGRTPCAPTNKSVQSAKSAVFFPSPPFDFGLRPPLRTASHDRASGHWASGRRAPRRPSVCIGG